MNLATFSPALFVVGAFTLATVLEPYWSAQPRQQAKSAMELALGDGRRLFANHFFTKADVYFHNGYYPSIFDQAARKPDSHLTEAAEGHADSDHDEHAKDAHGHGHAEKEDILGEPHDWLETFGRNFFVSKHTHMQNSQSRELLPWFKIAAELDPSRVETYTVAAFWLRTTLHKPDEAEAFLREGWRANPDSYAILLELGRLYFVDRKDSQRAQNLWELALKKWEQSESSKPENERDEFVHQQLLAHLADLAEHNGDLRGAVAYLRQLEKLSPFPETIRKRIDELNPRLK